MSDFLTALGLVLVIEGVFYGGFPKLAKRVIVQVLEIDDNTLRSIGAVSVIAGMGLIWYMRG